MTLFEAKLIPASSKLERHAGYKLSTSSPKAKEDGNGGGEDKSIPMQGKACF